MQTVASTKVRSSIHGQGVEINCMVTTMLGALDRTLGPFLVGSLPNRHTPVTGTIRPFDQDEVVRYLPPQATRLGGERDLLELYQLDERFWVIDDHWGLCELNTLKGQWRSWIIAEPTIDALRCVEQAVMWPMAQLLRLRGLHIIPSAAVVRDGWGVLIICSFGLEPELTALVRAGFRIIGQNWTALHESHGRIVMHQMPGFVERLPTRMGLGRIEPRTSRIDLTSQFPGSAADSAACDAVLLIGPGRRPLANLRPVSPTNAVASLRRAWPIAELHPHRRQGQLPPRIARRCRIFNLQLSRDPKDLLYLLDCARHERVPAPRAAVQIPPPARAVA